MGRREGGREGGREGRKEGRKEGRREDGRKGGENAVNVYTHTHKPVHCTVGRASLIATVVYCSEKHTHPHVCVCIIEYRSSSKLPKTHLKRGTLN